MTNPTWSRIACEVADVLRHQEARPLVPVGSLTDLAGEFGRPLVYTEWGFKDTEQPVMREYRWPKQDRPCEHYAAMTMIAQEEDDD